MESVAILNPKLQVTGISQKTGLARIADQDILCGSVTINAPRFDIFDPRNADYVLVRVNAFSCNYRDKALIVRAAEKMEAQEDAQPFAFFGSDFVGTVKAVGSNVSDLRAGMRVIPDCAYPYISSCGVAAGVVTNEASRGWLRLHRAKLLPIPDSMSDEIAASYSIGSQTSYSMVRRTDVKEGDKALVLSARSNTSMFIMKALLAHGVDVTAVSTSSWTEEEKSHFQSVHFIEAPRIQRDWDSDTSSLIREKFFDELFDPYYDLHLPFVLKYLKPDGRYITCGFKNQHDSFVEDVDISGSDRFDNLLLSAMINDISIIGNCIGTHEDIVESIKRFTPHNWLPIDSVWSVSDGASFLYRTYSDKRRFGKAVLRYTQE